MAEQRPHFTIRPAVSEDAPALMALVRELAEYERGLHMVRVTTDDLRRDGFETDPPLFGAYVAEMDGRTVGMSLYYYRYSTWLGKRLYLEDLYVQPHLRRHGIGQALWERTVQHAHLTGCTGMMWQVLDWNTPAIDFYKRMGARLDPEWVNGHLDF
jgi:GNAT superfamily N-acetyltransferase